IDRNCRIVGIRKLIVQASNRRIGKRNQQQSVLERVLVEDVAEAGGEDRLDAEARQSPHCELPRTSASEVRPCDDDCRAAKRLSIEDELRILRAIEVVTPASEQAIARIVLETPLPRSGDYRVRVDT